MSEFPHCFTHCAAIARKHGRWAQGIEARVLAEAIATEIEAADRPPGLPEGGARGGIVGPPKSAASSFPAFQPEGEEDDQTT